MSNKRFSECGLGFSVRVHSACYLWGVNTGVGKTWVSSLLTLGALSCDRSVCYVKPLQTGYPTDSDTRMVYETALRYLPAQTSKRLWAYTHSAWLGAVGPHRTALNEGGVCQEGLALRFLERLLQNPDAQLCVVEGAGGVLSPSACGLPQAEVFRKLRLPVVLVCDTQLGGVSASLASFEALFMRGYSVVATVWVGADALLNASAFAEVLSQMGYSFLPSIIHVPSPHDTHVFHSHESYINQGKNLFLNVQESFARWESSEKVDSCSTLENIAALPVWWPFTQHAQLPLPVPYVQAAHGDSFIFRGLELSGQNKETESQESIYAYDATASWWTQGFGHGDSGLSLHMAHAASRYGHVLFPQLLHKPALDLAEKLLASVGRPWAHKVFYSDNGSTAIEIALKMAFRLREKRLGIQGNSERSGLEKKGVTLNVVGLRDSYHGDTLGAMNSCSPSVFNAKENWYTPKGCWFEIPEFLCENGSWKISHSPAFVQTVNQTCGAAYQEAARASLTSVYGSRDALFNREPECTGPWSLFYEHFIEAQLLEWEKQWVLGCVLIEPLIHGAAGMIGVDPLFQRALVRVAKQRGIPVIYDEVFSGFWRFGVESAKDFLGGISPDIACYAKLLTGGSVPLAVTLASQEVFNGFWSHNKADALLHGHSYTAHPVGCAAALMALNLYRASFDSKKNHPVDFWPLPQVEALSRQPGVKRVLALGSVLAVEVKGSPCVHEKFLGEDLVPQNSSYTQSAAAPVVNELRRLGIYCRPLGNTIYIMASFELSEKKSLKIIKNLSCALSKVFLS